MIRLKDCIEDNKDLLHDYIKVTAEGLYLLNSPSLNYGNAGCALFLGIAGKKFNNTSYTDKALEFIEKSIDSISTNEKTPSSLAYGFAGVSYVLNYFSKVQILDQSDIKFLHDIDHHILKTIKVCGEIKNYDLFKGLIGFGIYLLNRNTKAADDGIALILNELEQIWITEQSNLKWPTLFQPTQIKFTEYNFGMAHGIPSVISFLSKLKLTKHWSVNAERMLYLTIEQMRTVRQDGRKIGSFYPGVYIPENKHYTEHKSVLSWCYGDLGVGLSLIHAYNTSGDKSFFEEASEIFTLASSRDIKDSLIYCSNNYSEACLCHGTLGNAYIFKKAMKYIEDSSIEKASVYWFEQFLIDRVKSKRSPLEYYSLVDEEKEEMIWHNDLSLMEGASGVALCLSALLSEDYNEWEELFFLDI